MGIIDDVKMWNRVLNEDEVTKASLPASVEPNKKLATAWGNIKSPF
ncbi:MAG: hypothetical protein ACUVWN_08220 [bacterium]